MGYKGVHISRTCFPDGLSFTDLVVGLTTTPATLFPIVFPNTRYETCALTMYMYFCAQAASLCHSLLICINRLLTIILKRPTNANVTFKTIMMQILAVWGFCLLFYVIHFLSYARFGETVKQCSTIYLFGDNEFFVFGLMTIPPLVPPQLCTNIIYVYLLMYVRKRLRIDVEEPIDPGAPCRGFLKGIIF